MGFVAKHKYIYIIHSLAFVELIGVVRVMAIGDLWRLIDRQYLAGQPVLNVYFYQETVAPAVLDAPFALVQAFRDAVETPALFVQSSSLLHVGFDVTNLDNPDEFGSFAITTSGAVSSESLPPFVSWAFKLNRATRLVRNGQKRFAGVPESMQVTGEATSGALTLLSTLATALGAPIEQTVPDGTWEPRIAHRLGTVPETYQPYLMAGASYSRISSQNTRKFGRGA